MDPARVRQQNRDPDSRSEGTDGWSNRCSASRTLHIKKYLEKSTQFWNDVDSRRTFHTHTYKPIRNFQEKNWIKVANISKINKNLVVKIVSIFFFVVFRDQEYEIRGAIGVQ